MYGYKAIIFKQKGYFNIMKTKYLIKILSFILALTLIICTVSCATGNEGENETQKTQGTTPVENGEVETNAKDPLAGLDFKNNSFRIYTSINIASEGMGNSNFMIEGTGEHGTDITSEAVYNRNVYVEDLLKVKLEYTHADFIYNEVAADIEMYIKSGADDYDLIINDLYPLTGLSLKNYFANTKNRDKSYFDFSQKYWYSDYMSDISLHEDYQFILAGDYFIDIIRSAHCLFFNKNIYRDRFGDPDELYDKVLNYEWTYDQWLNLINEAYVPANSGSSEPDIENDQFGFLVSEVWGSMIPMIASGGCDYMIRNEEGYPEIDMNTDRVLDLATAINDIYYSNGSYTTYDSTKIINAFASGRALFIGYQRLGTLENADMREMQENAKGILPYPMLKKEDHKYTTSSHDTTEVGVIPNVLRKNKFDFVSAVIEALCRSTSEIVMPQYYDKALKIKYASDESAAAMIDIIHDNFDNVFQLAFDISLGDLYKNVIYWPIQNKNPNTVASKLKSQKGSANKKLTKIIKDFKKQIDK